MYPNIRLELLQGDYIEIETWIADGVVGFGFICLPSIKNLETIFLKKDRMMTIVSKDHPYAKKLFFLLKHLLTNLLFYWDQEITGNAAKEVIDDQ